MEQNKRIRKIVNSTKQPSKNCIWLKDGKLYYYGTTGWTEIQGQDKVTEVATIWTDVDGMKYRGSTITKFQDGYKFAPRTGNNCYEMFDDCKKLTEVPLFDTSEAQSMSYMFAYCTLIKGIPLFDMSSATSISNMFTNCDLLETVPQFNTKKVTDFDNMFNYCNNLKSVPKLDMSNGRSVNRMFYQASALTTLGGFTGLKRSLDLSQSNNLTKESLLNVINEAADVTSDPQTLTFGATNLAKLTDEEKAIATSKGWTLA